MAGEAAVREIHGDRRETKGGKHQPPHSIEAEEGVIGAVIIDPSVLPAVLEVAAPGDFYQGAHRKVMAAMAELHERRVDVDLVTLSEQLKSTGELREIGGPVYLAELHERVPTAANAVAYARIVRQQARRRDLITELAELQRQLYENGQPVHEYVPGELGELMEIAASSDDRTESLSQTLTRVALEADKRQSGETPPAIATGLADLDAAIGGIHLGHFLIAAGVSSHGKTSFATEIIERPLAEGVGVGFVSADTAKDELLERMACQRAGVCTQDFVAGRLGGDDMVKVHNALAEIHDQPLQIIDDLYSWPRIKVSIGRMVANGAKVIVIDHLTLLENQPPKGRRVEYHEEIAGITRDIQQITRQGVAVILLVQIDIDPKHRDRHGRLSKAWRPAPSMLRGGKTAFQNANEVLLLYWHGREHPDEPGTVVDGWEPFEVQVAKVKMGDPGKLKLRFHPPSMRFVDYFSAEVDFPGDGGGNSDEELFDPTARE